MKPVTYFSNLTPLRGIAALLTVIFHIGLMVGPLLNNSNLLNRMYLMVDFFFVLSGFIMCHVYGNLFSGAVTIIAYKKFTIARFARVYPLHFVTLLYTVILFYVSAKLGIPKVPVLQVENSGYSFVTNLLLLQSMNLHHWFSWVHASWSISTEWWAYMIFPFLVRPFTRLTSNGKVLIAFLCFAGYLCITFFIIPIVTIPKEIPFVKTDPADLSINVGYQFGFIRCLCGFVLGMIMYQGFANNWGKKILANGYAMGIAALGLFVSMHAGLPDVISVSFLPFLLLSAAYGSKAIDKLFATKALQRLGEWSFSIYLVHQPLIFTIGSIMAYLNPIDPNKPASGPPPAPSILISWGICLVFIAITLFVSSLMYRFWELPARRWINLKAS
jgi:peptidoglycan/LPS O-acetylase OafA/YrhL